MRFVFTAACLLGAFATQLPAATIITFEVIAPPGQVLNVNPSAPYSESGFTLTPSKAESAVFDAAVGGFPGDTTSWFGFAGFNTITLPAQANLI
jgi:hypothetical protein